MKRGRCTFWGVRGSIAVAGPRTRRYGGNTSCLHVECGGAHVILEAGTGIRALGNALSTRFRGKPLEACILLSHLHWDHYFGLPFFKPLADARNAFVIAGPALGSGGFARQLDRAIAPPYFPVRLAAFPAAMELMTVGARGFGWGGIAIVPVPANHPDGACGWRLFLPNGRSLVVMTDDEPVSGPRRRELVRRIHGADVLVHDAQYTPETYERRRGWGHSPFSYPIELAKAAGIRRLWLTHFDPDADDRELDRRRKAIRHGAGAALTCELAREGRSFAI